MILTCPECATSYFVDDSRIPAEGRRVKCSSCGHRWTAGPDGPIAPEPAAAEAAPEPPPQPEPEPLAAAPLDEIEPEPQAFVPPPVRRPTGRSGRYAKSRRKPPTSALVWAGAAALVAALLAGLIVFREQVVRAWPASAAAYAGLGLQVHGAGLVLEKIEAKPAFLAGRPVLSVTGAIRNVRDVPVEAPPVRFTLLNRAGQPVAAKIARPVDAHIPARATRHFKVTMLDPPATARDLEVRFDAPGAGKAARAQAGSLSAAPSAGPRSEPTPVEAHAAPVGEAQPAPSAAGAPAGLSPAAATEHG